MRCLLLPCLRWLCVHRRHLRRLLVELIDVAKASRGREVFDVDLTPVGEEFDPLAIP